MYSLTFVELVFHRKEQFFPAQPSGVFLCLVSLLFYNIIRPCFQFLLKRNTNLLKFIVGQLAFILERIQTSAYIISVLFVQLFKCCQFLLCCSGKRHFALSAACVFVEIIQRTNIRVIFAVLTFCSSLGFFPFLQTFGGFAEIHISRHSGAVQ